MDGTKRALPFGLVIGASEISKLIRSFRERLRLSAAMPSAFPCENPRYVKLEYPVSFKTYSTRHGTSSRAV